MDDLSELEKKEIELSKLEAEARLYNGQLKELEELEKNGTNEQGIGGN